MNGKTIIRFVTTSVQVSKLGLFHPLARGLGLDKLKPRRKLLADAIFTKLAQKPVSSPHALKVFLDHPDFSHAQLKVRIAIVCALKVDSKISQTFLSFRIGFARNAKRQNKQKHSFPRSHALYHVDVVTLKNYAFGVSVLADFDFCKVNHYHFPLSHFRLSAGIGLFCYSEMPFRKQKRRSAEEAQND